MSSPHRGPARKWNAPCRRIETVVSAQSLSPEKWFGKSLKREEERVNTPLELFLFQFPLRIAHPIVHVNPVAAHIVLEFFSLAALIFMKLLKIREALGRRLKAWFLAVDGFSEELFGRHLDGRRLLVLDPRGSSRRLHDGDDAITNPRIPRSWPASSSLCSVCRRQQLG